VAGALSYALGVTNCFSMNVEFYTGVDERLEVPVVLPPTLDLVDIRGLRVLIADDVTDTGRTLELIRKEIAEHVAEPVPDGDLTGVCTSPRVPQVRAKGTCDDDECRTMH
jgi:hypoxanthine phosphoribosyltransferase